MSKYLGFEDQWIAKAVAHREALENGQKGKLYLDGMKVKVKDGGAVIEFSDDYEWVTEKCKTKVKDTEDDALLDKVEKVKTGKEKDKDKDK